MRFREADGRVLQEVALRVGRRGRGRAVAALAPPAPRRAVEGRFHRRLHEGRRGTDRGLRFAAGRSESGQEAARADRRLGGQQGRQGVPRLGQEVRHLRRASAAPSGVFTSLAAASPRNVPSEYPRPWPRRRREPEYPRARSRRRREPRPLTSPVAAPPRTVPSEYPRPRRRREASSRNIHVPGVAAKRPLGISASPAPPRIVPSEYPRPRRRREPSPRNIHVPGVAAKRPLGISASSVAAPQRLALRLFELGRCPQAATTAARPEKSTRTWRARRRSASRTKGGSRRNELKMTCWVWSRATPSRI